MANSLTHVLPYPILNARYTTPLTFRVAAGTPTDPTTPDTEISVDGGASFSDCAEEITTGGGNGCGYLTLTGAETNNSTIFLAAKSANDVTTPAIIQPRRLAIVGSGTLSAGSAGGGTLGTLLAYDVTGCFIRTTGGTGGGGTGGANNQARRLITYNASTGAFTVSPNWETTPSTDTTYDILLPEGVTLGMLKALNPTTPGRTATVDSSGRVLSDLDTIKTQTLTASASITFGVYVGGTGAAALETTSQTILADSNELQTDWADGGRLDLILDARASQTSVDDLPTNAELTTALGTADDAVLAAISTVQSDTDNIQSRLPAALTADGNMKVDLQRISGFPVAVDTGTAGTISFISGAYVATSGDTVSANLVQIDGESVVSDGNGRLIVNAETYYDSNLDDYVNFPDGFTSFDNPDNTTIGTINTKIGTPAGVSVSADIAAVKTDTGNLASRVTASLFSGITSLAQWLGLIAGKQVGNSTARTELRATGAGSGTFDETTDSLEAIGDKAMLASSYTAPPSAAAIDMQLSGTHGAGSWLTGSGGGGTGARTVTITVDDGTDPLENAKVRLTEGVESRILETDADGIAEFSLDDATWAVSITKPGYQFTPTTLLVNSDESQTYSMTAVAITPSDPDLVTYWLLCLDENSEPEADVVFHVQNSEVNDLTGVSLDSTVAEFVSNEAGLLSVTNRYPGSAFKIWRGTSPTKYKIEVAEDGPTVVELPAVLGKG